jgi:hypothetical protein
MPLVSGKRMAKSKKGGVKADILSQTATSVAARVSGSVGRTRSGRDSITRVKSPIKVADTQSRQWNRYGP